MVEPEEQRNAEIMQVRRIGHARIAVSQNEARRVADILAHVGPDRFERSKDVERAVAQAWDQIADLRRRRE